MRSGFHFPHILPDGHGLFFVMAVRFQAEGGSARIGSPRELFRGDYFTPPPGMLGRRRRPQVVLVQNFLEELKLAQVA